MHCSALQPEWKHIDMFLVAKHATNQATEILEKQM